MEAKGVVRNECLRFECGLSERHVNQYCSMDVEKYGKRGVKTKEDRLRKTTRTANCWLYCISVNFVGRWKTFGG
jgi:hypothetical protein